MTPEQIAQAYDQITHLWTRSGFNLNNGIGAHQQAISLCQNKGMALDIGCGCTGRFIRLLQQNGFEVEGVDLSLKMLEIARKSMPDVTFHQQDICTWKSSGTYDFISAWDCLWHVPLDQQASVIAKLLGWLNKGGVMIFSFGALEHASEHTDASMGPELYYATLGKQRTFEVIEQADCKVAYFESDQAPELHSFVIAQKVS
ncbi:class I SAM-dependent methyltransferase [Neptunicella marina]|uniref:Class I SAM-dependent methyltransferase n=1 Tax=Neptunicella marina TaxID=2125989 RepID=A0A8J6IW27_9ALTE|nr:class I SAM-dependent methyltransferase [Neptunicella marina]MBC3767339.1 class I SAM-dependent methyltransferase [Neptunicella marina]